MTEDRQDNDRRTRVRRSSDHYPVAYGPAFHNDEISLADLVGALWRRRWVVLGVAAAVTAVAAAYAFTRPPQYEYTAALQIGHRPEPDGARNRLVAPLQTPANVIAQLENAQIPHAIRTVRADLAQGNEKPPVPGIRVDSPEDSRTVRLRATAPVAHERLYTEVMEYALQTVVERHGVLHENERALYESRLAKARLELQRLRNETLFDNRLADHRDGIEAARDRLTELGGRRELLLANREARLAEQRRKIADVERELEALQSTRELLAFRLDQLDRRRDLLQGQAGRLEDYVQEASAHQLRASSASVEPARAMSLMLLGNQVQQLRTRLDDIEQRLAVDLPERRESLEDELADNARSQEAARERKAALEQALQELRVSFDQKLADNERAQRDREREIARLERELEAMRIERDQSIDAAVQDVRQLEARVASFVPTRILAEPTRSLQPVGISGRIVATLGLVLGLMAGVVLALLVDAVARERADRGRGQEDPPTDTPRVGPSPARGAAERRRDAG